MEFDEQTYQKWKNVWMPLIKDKYGPIGEDVMDKRQKTIICCDAEHEIEILKNEHRNASENDILKNLSEQKRCKVAKTLKISQSIRRSEL